MMRNKKVSLMLTVCLVLMAAMPVLADGEGLEKAVLVPGWLGGFFALLAFVLVVGTILYATRGSGK